MDTPMKYCAKVVGEDGERCGKPGQIRTVGLDGRVRLVELCGDHATPLEAAFEEIILISKPVQLPPVNQAAEVRRKKVLWRDEDDLWGIRSSGGSKPMNYYVSRDGIEWAMNSIILWAQEQGCYDLPVRGLAPTVVIEDFFLAFTPDEFLAANWREVLEEEGRKPRW